MRELRATKVASMQSSISFLGLGMWQSHQPLRKGPTDAGRPAGQTSLPAARHVGERLVVLAQFDGHHQWFEFEVLDGMFDPAQQQWAATWTSQVSELSRPSLARMIETFYHRSSPQSCGRSHGKRDVTFRPRLCENAKQDSRRSGTMLEFSGPKTERTERTCLWPAVHRWIAKPNRRFHIPSTRSGHLR